MLQFSIRVQNLLRIFVTTIHKTSPTCLSALCFGAIIAQAGPVCKLSQVLYHSGAGRR
jgi:hypothetical protein